MTTITEQIDKIKERLSDPIFLENKGLSNEVGTHIFCYDPKEEITVQEGIKMLKALKNVPFRIIECDLYELFIQLLKENEILEEVGQMEESEGSDYLLEQLKMVVTPESMTEKMQYEPHIRKQDVLFITGVGKVHPFIRVHSLLENIQHVFQDIPIVMFYPGVFTGKSLCLFDEYVDGNNYRAFSLLNENRRLSH